MNKVKNHARVLVFALILAGCGTTGSVKEETLLLGWTDRTAIQSPSYPHFKARYDTVQVAQEMVDLIREMNTGGDWLIFFGSWCSDSWREVPTFLKIADHAGFDWERIRFYGLDRGKESPGGLEKQFDIELVPTLIFQREGKEVGRIVETPVSSMEDDMLLLLTAPE